METSNRNHSVLVISLLIVFTVGIFVFIFRDKLGSWRQQASQPPVAAGPYDKLLEVKCDFADDRAAYTAAMEKVNPAFCGCIKDEKTSKDCDSQSLEALKFQQVVKQLDAVRCKEFSVEQQNTCELAIAGRLEAMSNDPALLADSYMQSGNYAKAAEVLNKTGNQDADNLLMLALIYANQGLAEHKEAEFVPKALALVEKSLKLKADNPEAYRVQGYIYEVKPDYEAAFDSYDKALAMDQDYILAYIGRGHARNMRGRLPDALADLIKAKELDSKRQYPQIYEQLCRLEMASPMLEAAVADCKINAELTSGPGRGEAHGMLAELLIKAEKYDEAEAQVKIALTYAPKNPNSMVVASKVYYAQGNYAQSVSYARQAITLDAAKASPYVPLGRSLDKQKKTDEAIAVALKGLGLVDADVSILKPYKGLAKKELADLLASLYGQKGDSANAKKYQEYVQTEQQQRIQQEQAEDADLPAPGQYEQPIVANPAVINY